MISGPPAGAIFWRTSVREAAGGPPIAHRARRAPGQEERLDAPDGAGILVEWVRFLGPAERLGGGELDLIALASEGNRAFDPLLADRSGHLRSEHPLQDVADHLVDYQDVAVDGAAA